MSILGALLAFVIGAFIGKWLALAVDYLPQILFEDGEREREPRHLIGYYFQRRFCSACQTPLRWQEALPIFGYLSLKGRCPHCQHPFGLQVLIIELATALLFGLSVLLFPFNLSLLFVLLVSCLLICCFMTDYQHGILPDQFTLSLVWVGLLASLQPLFISPPEAIVGAISGYLIFWGFNLLFRAFRGIDGMYPGDFKLNAGIGACIGLHCLIPVIISSFLLLLGVTITQALCSKEKVEASLLRREVPYGCFAAIVTLVMLYLKLLK